MRLKRIDTINVIPFIDIMLVLLVMVLTTATFIKTGLIAVDLPEASSGSADHKPTELKVTIKKDGTLWLSETESVTLQALEQKIAQGGKEMTVVLYSDKEAQFQNFVGVMDVLKRLNHEQMYIVTEK